MILHSDICNYGENMAYEQPVQTPEQFLAKIKSAYAQRNFAGADRAIREAYSRYPKNEDIVIENLRRLLKKKRYREAKSILEPFLEQMRQVQNAEERPANYYKFAAMELALQDIETLRTPSGLDNTLAKRFNFRERSKTLQLAISFMGRAKLNAMEKGTEVSASNQIWVTLGDEPD